MGIGVQHEEKQNNQPWALTSNLYLSQKKWSRLWQSNQETVCESYPPPSCFTFLFSAGIKGVYDYYPVSIANEYSYWD